MFIDIMEVEKLFFDEAIVEGDDFMSHHNCHQQ